MKFTFAFALLLAPLVSFAKAPTPTPVVPPVEISPIDSPEWAIVIGTSQEKTDLVRSTRQALAAAQFSDCENNQGLLIFRDRSYANALSDLQAGARIYRHASGTPILKFAVGALHPSEHLAYSETTLHLTADRRAIRSISIEYFRWLRQNLGTIDQPNFQFARQSTEYRSCSN